MANHTETKKDWWRLPLIYFEYQVERETVMTLPPRWKDFKNYLKHKRKEMNLEELIVRL